jgi:hypothetical protein
MRTDLLWRGPGRATKPAALVASVAFAAGGLLLVWSGYIHFHLWDENDGYRHIATIGPLFLLQSIAGLLLGLLVIAARRVWVAIVGIGFAIATMVGFLISVDHGLFGFKESWQAPDAHLAFDVEIAVIVVLLIAGALSSVRSASVTKGGATAAVPTSSGA